MSDQYQILQDWKDQIDQLLNIFIIQASGQVFVPDIPTILDLKNDILDQLSIVDKLCSDVLETTMDENCVPLLKNRLHTKTKVYSFSDGQNKEIPNELVFKYSDSLFNVNFIDVDSRNLDKEIEIDFQLRFLNEIVKYMNNEYDINELSSIEFDKFCRELMEMRIPFRMDIMNRLYNGSNEYGVGWKNRYILLKNNKYRLMMNYITLNGLSFNTKEECISAQPSLPFPCSTDAINDIERYLHDPSSYVMNPHLTVDDIYDTCLSCGLDVSSDILKKYLLNYSASLFCSGSSILDSTEYDDILKKWIGVPKMTKIYQASKHQFLALSFHKYCNDMGPTLILIKTTDGYIFGGYTTQSWNGFCMLYFVRSIF